MTLLILLSGSGAGGSPPPVIIINSGVILVVSDIGNYVKSADVGRYVTQVKGGTVTGSIGILRWGLAQFGSTGILGYTPTIFQNHQRMNVVRV